MTFSRHGWQKSFFLNCVCLASLAIAGTCAAQDKESDRAERAAKLDAKISDLRAEFKILRQKLGEAGQQAKANIQAEIEDLRNQMQSEYQQLQQEYQDEIGLVQDDLAKAWKEFNARKADARQSATEQIERLRTRWNEYYERLNTAHQESVQQLRDQLDELEKQAQAKSEEITYAWIEKQNEIKDQYESAAAKMRDSYQSYIETLQAEADRIAAAAKSADVQTRAKMMAKYDEVNSKMNEAYERLHGEYVTMAETANSYVRQTKVRMEKAGGQAKQKIEAQIAEISQSMRVAYCEMAASYEEYRDSLDGQIETIKARAKEASGEVQSDMNAAAEKLAAKRDEANQKMEAAYTKAQAALENEIAAARQAMDRADERARADMVQGIDEMQAELEKVKQKLKSNK